MSLVESQKDMADLLPCNEECGGDYGRYSFGQTDTEVIVKVPLPSDTPTKMINVDVKVSSLTIGMKGQSPLISGDLYKPVKVDECTWCVEDKSVLVVTLVKTNAQYEEWWPCVTTNERQIDMKTFRPPSKHISELDDSARATIAKMMFDQRQKALNLPSSDELRLRELMQRGGTSN
ncbi:nuclear movement protein, putative [Trypanosoma equiperdum]|uniref:Nuclear movement protein, putative n=3 Tax=Trypanozoon TaxID=39700 RepID=Q584U3_TRYB2|nr:nuclear movement protein, putative [Trypanosoma brucei brucei TREU927]AAX80846.1 nuclear movement protein, putative [Trypanosoma brucei]AAZ11775.1 nuclear movement protein, putative [Trypanosoma brucei brucei TREU927]SCU72689.1 nuclear movement protein, putative [Trypanosoma equiperdum]